LVLHNLYMYLGVFVT